MHQPPACPLTKKRSQSRFNRGRIGSFVQDDEVEPVDLFVRSRNDLQAALAVGTSGSRHTSSRSVPPMPTLHFLLDLGERGQFAIGRGSRRKVESRGGLCLESL